MSGILNVTYTMEDVFAKRLLCVPNYQRGYAWGEQQWAEMLEDMELLSPGKDHYTGTLVLHRREERQRDLQGISYQVCDVVDGQQRLTTVVLLLDAIRRELADQNLAQGIVDIYIFKLDRNEEKMPKLTLNEDCHRFFFEVVLGDGSIDGPSLRSHQNLLDARHYFQKHLASKRADLGNLYQEWLRSLCHTIRDRLRLTVYEVPQAAEAGVIFEVMNNRGRPITELEKVKNYLLYVSSKLVLDEKVDIDEEVGRTWTRIFETLMAHGLGHEDKEDQLLRSHWLMSRDPNERNWDGSKSIKGFFSLKLWAGKHKVLLKGLRKYLSVLRSAASAYCDIEKPIKALSFRDYPTAERVRAIESGQRLARLNVVAPFLPLLMALRLRHVDRIDCYLEALHLCEAYAFRVFRMLESPSHAGRSKLFRLGHELYEGQKTVEEALDRLRTLIHAYSPDDEIKAEMTKYPDDCYHWTGIKYFLFEYEQHLCRTTNKSLKISWADLTPKDPKRHTIEHILPQNPEEGYWTENFPDAEEREQLTHDIGNLCLTRDNSSYGRKPFPEKRGAPGASAPCYAEGDTAQERELAGIKDWTPQEIKRRNKRIIKWALERWHVEKAGALGKAEADEEDDLDEVADEPRFDAAC